MTLACARATCTPNDTPLDRCYNHTGSTGSCAAGGYAQGYGKCESVTETTRPAAQAGLQ